MWRNPKGVKQARLLYYRDGALLRTDGAEKVKLFQEALEYGQRVTNPTTQPSPVSNGPEVKLYQLIPVHFLQTRKCSHVGNPSTSAHRVISIGIVR